VNSARGARPLPDERPVELPLQNASRPLAAAGLLALAILGGCEIAVPVHQSRLEQLQAERMAGIRPGESTRAEVQGVLGEPWLESRDWRVELYRASDERSVIPVVIVLVFPAPMGLYTDELHGYTLVGYDADGRVSEVSSAIATRGSWWRGPLYGRQDLAIRADDLTFLIDSGRHRPALLADPARLPEYMALRRAASTCTLVVACDLDAGCPDQVGVDVANSLDPSPILTSCDPRQGCPRPTVATEPPPDGPGFQFVYTVSPIGVPPGDHRLVVTSSVLDGRSEAAFTCSAGQVLHAAVHSRVEGASRWFARKTMLATVAFSSEAPSAWAGRMLALYRGDRWVVERAPESNP
jgi:hypothetical protein